MMVKKLISIILIISILSCVNTVYADIDDDVNLDDYNYVKYVESFYSDGEETKKLYPVIYFDDEFEQIYSVSISEAVVEGREARGALLEYSTYSSNNYDFITPIPSLNQGEKLNGTKRIYGLKRAIISLKADVGELWLKYITGTVNGYSYIIIFSESGHGGDPGTDPEPEPEPEPEPPDTPRNVETDSKAGDIIVTWDPVPGAEGYRVWINGDPIDVGDDTEYIFTANPGEYEIQVSAYNNDGESGKSNPITAIRPPDNPIVIVNPPACECKPPKIQDVNIVGVENPIPIYFPDPPAPPKAPSINPLPNPGNYIPKPNDFDMEPDMPSYNPRYYDPGRDGPIFEYNPPPLDIPEPIESPGPLPAIPDPIIIAHDDPLDKDTPKQKDKTIDLENPINQSEPYNPEEPKEMDPVQLEPPRELDPINVEPPREMTGYEPEPPRDMTGYTPEPPRQMTGYEPESPYTPEPPKNMDPPIDKR